MEKTLLIHKGLRVYYYYQSVYKLVYYNNKTSSANPAPTASTLKTCRPPAWFATSWPTPSARIAPEAPLARKSPAKLFFSALLITRLWKSRCISTGSDVQNAAIPASFENCPRFVQTPHRLCSAGNRVCKSLMLWSKRELSTEEAAFTIYYQFVYKL